jgi:hypothetical protein
MEIRPSCWLMVIDDADIIGPSPRVLFDSLNAHEPEKFGWANKLPGRKLKDTNANNTGNEILINRLPGLRIFLLFMLFLLKIKKFKTNQKSFIKNFIDSYFLFSVISYESQKNKIIYQNLNISLPDSNNRTNGHRLHNIPIVSTLAHLPAGEV